MERNIKNLGTAENILVLCSRFWLKAHVFKCNTPLILIDHTFKAAKIDDSVRYFHTLMMGLSHLNKTNLRSDFMTSPLTSKNENLLIEIISFAQKDMKEDISLLVANSYLQILFNKESLGVQKSQLDIANEELVFAKERLKSGIIPA